MELKLVDFESDLWKSYSGAYGIVKDLVALLLDVHTNMPAQKKLNRFDTEPKDN